MQNNQLQDLPSILNAELSKFFTHTLPDKRIKEFEQEYLENFENCFSKKYKGSIQYSFRQFVKRYGNIKLSQITPDMAQKFILEKFSEAPYAAASHKRTLKAAMGRAYDYGYITFNPFAKIKLPKKQERYPAYITVDQLQKIINKEDQTILKQIFVILFFTGMRAGEVVNLRWPEVNLDRRIIQVGSEKFQTKSKKIREIPMTDKIFKIFYDLFPGKVTRSKLMDAFVFSKKNNFPFTVDCISKHFKKACREAGMDERIHLHCLRHSFASGLVQKDVPLYEVKTLLGHQSITTTERYSHLQIDSLRDAVSKLDGTVYI